jgi:hypothetical protein
MYHKRTGLLLRIAVIAFLGIILSSQLQAQSTPKQTVADDKGWVSFGIGNDEPIGLAVGFTANFGRTHFWQAGIEHSSELNIFGGESSHITSIHAGRGYSFVHRVGRIAFAAGPALNWGLDDSNTRLGEHSPFTSVGLVGNGQFILTPIKELGIGIELYSNINNVVTVTGLRLILTIEGNK